MRSIRLLIPGIVAVLLGFGHQVRLASGDQGAQFEVRELEDQLARAVVRGDRAFFERVLADDFTHTSHSGVFKTRAQWLAEGKGGDRPEPKAAATRYDAMEVDDLAVRVYGDTAVVTGRTTPKGQNAKGQPITGQYRFLRVWVKRKGQWQAVAFQGTRVSQP